MELCLVLIIILVIGTLVLGLLHPALGIAFLGVMLFLALVYTLVGAVVLFIIDTVAGTDYFSWTNAFLVGLLLAILSAAFGRSGGD